MSLIHLCHGFIHFRTKVWKNACIAVAILQSHADKCLSVEDYTACHLLWRLYGGCATDTTTCHTPNNLQLTTGKLLHEHSQCQTSSRPQATDALVPRGNSRARSGPLPNLEPVFPPFGKEKSGSRMASGLFWTREWLMSWAKQTMG